MKQRHRGCPSCLTMLPLFIPETSFYDPSRPFSCFDGSKTIEFSEVNDDYCDCPDGSDEPGWCSNFVMRSECSDYLHLFQERRLVLMVIFTARMLDISHCIFTPAK